MLENYFDPDHPLGGNMGADDELPALEALFAEADRIQPSDGLAGAELEWNRLMDQMDEVDPGSSAEAETLQRLDALQALLGDERVEQMLDEV